MNKDNKSLSQQVVVGGILVTILKGIERSLTIIRLVILARLLSPDDFGMMGVALLTLTTFETFTRPGFQKALIQKKDNVEHYLDSAWTMLVLRGIVLAVVIYFAAPIAAAFFDAPEATIVIRSMSLAIVFFSFTNIGVIFFQKELQFHKQVFYQITGVIADFTVAVVLAVVLRNLWALVFGVIAGHFTRMVISFVIHPYRPRFDLDLKRAGELFQFGKWVLGSSILIFLITQGDSIIVGKIAGIAALGFYQVAYRISNVTATEISHVISQVTFPAYSKLQDETQRLCVGYLKVLKVVAFICVPLATFIIMLGHDFTLIFMKEKWLPMVPVLQILSMAGLFRALAATVGPVFYAIGKPSWDTRIQVIRLVIMVSLLFPLLHYLGISGAALSVTISVFITMIIFFVFLVSALKCDLRGIIRALIFPTLSSSLVVAVILILQHIVSPINIIKFFGIAIAGGIVYLGSIFLWQYLFSYEIIPILKEHAGIMKFKRKSTPHNEE